MQLLKKKKKKKIVSASCVSEEGLDNKISPARLS